MHDRLSRVLHDEDIAKAQEEVAKNNAKKDHGNAGHTGIVSRSENYQVRPFNPVKIIIENPCIRPLDFKKRRVPIYYIFDFWNPNIGPVEPLLLLHSRLTINNVMHNISVDSYLCQIRKRQVQNGDNGHEANGEQKEKPVRTNLGKESF
jgi:hypothetical protein